MALAGKAMKGWFHTPDRPGDRTLIQQLTGLDPLLERVKGRTVLDVGCAEGLISMRLAYHGADYVWGIDIVPEHVKVAREIRLAGLHDCSFSVEDANTYKPMRDYDIVLMLAVLHKLRDPTAACRRLAAAARELVVIRLPPKHAPKIVDERSGNVPHDIGATMHREGFVLAEVTTGHLDEWCGFFERMR